MNKMADLAKLLGKELGEEFIAKYSGGVKKRCKFLEKGLVISDTGESWEISRLVLFDLFLGECEIYNLPWKAEETQKYYVPNIWGKMRFYISPGDLYDWTQEQEDYYQRGLMCKTPEQAEELAQLLIKTARQFQGFDDEEEVRDI